MLKYDACIHNLGVAPRARYEAMARALNATGRQILYVRCLISAVALRWVMTFLRRSPVTFVRWFLLTFVRWSRAGPMSALFSEP